METKKETVIYLSTCSRCRNVETEKSYALKYRDLIVYIPKSQCKMEEVFGKEDLIPSYVLGERTSISRWWCTIPNWLIEKNEDLSQIINYFKMDYEKN